MSIKAAWELRTPWTIAGRDQTLAAYDQLCDYYAQCAPKKLYDLKMSGQTLDAMMDEKGRENKLLSNYMPALSKSHEFWSRERADTDALLTVIALLRYKKEHGQYPQTLQELVEAGLLKAIPQDPFGPATLTYMDDDGGIRGDRDWDDEDGDAVFWPVQTADKR